jgi:hypothetical protein
MVFNLTLLLQIEEDLSTLEEPFSHQEIDLAIKILPSNKSTGLDVFNTDFVKKCWLTIAFDYYELCEKFHEGSICKQSINGSYVTLVLKKRPPSVVGDYRVISLLNTSVKVLTKLLANHLQRVITNLCTKINMASSKKDPFKIAWLGLSNIYTSTKNKERNGDTDAGLQKNL